MTYDNQFQRCFCDVRLLDNTFTAGVGAASGCGAHWYPYELNLAAVAIHTGRRGQAGIGLAEQVDGEGRAAVQGCELV